MSLACELIPQNNNDDDNEEQQQHNEQFNSQQSSKNQLNQKKDVYEDEELDFEEEVEPSGEVNDDDNSKSYNEVDDLDDGELKDVEKDEGEAPKKIKSQKDKDEGEIDSDDELEEGEVKEDSDEEKLGTNNLNESESKKPLLEIPKNVPRRDLLRPPERKNYPNYPVWQSNQTYFNRHSNIKFDRYNNIILPRQREPLPTPLLTTPTSQESSWERGLKQARELISKASKRKEDEDGEIRNKLPDAGDRSPPPPFEKRRRHSSQNSSSEDEIERRHRLAYDAAPWNNPGPAHRHHYQQQPSSNYRNRSNYYSSTVANRSADTYRDPWSRSKSPKNVAIRSRSKDLDVDRYGELYKKEKSHSMSSLSSICSSSSHLSGDTDKSTGRKLPYSRPKLATDRIPNRNDDDLRLPVYDDRESSNSRSRFDRIPKKSNAISSPSMNYNRPDDPKRDSDRESFDSWSESLSDSSSYYSHSDSDEQEEKHVKKSSNNNESRGLQPRNTHDKFNRKSSSQIGGGNVEPMFAKDSKPSKYGINPGVGPSMHSQKVPIKMTFKKKQQSLKQDTIINEQLNGENISDIEEESNFSRISNQSLHSNKSEEEPISNDEDDLDFDNDSPTQSRREEILSKLKAVEEAIQRKLNSKN